MLFTSQLWLATGAMAVVLIGTDNNCDYQTNAVSIEGLINNGENIIRITNQAAVNESIHITKQVAIVGGYDNCTDASNMVNGNQPTTINSNQTGPVITVNSPNDGSDLQIYLRALKLTNGRNLGPHQGGGLSVYDNNDNTIIITLENSLLTNNRGNRGGGIYISGSAVSVSVYETTILNNEVLGTVAGTAMGGGVYCAAGKFLLNRDSGIYGNDAYSSSNDGGHGGGLYATNGCEVSLSSGTTGGLFDLRGISNNTASSHGGGVYIKNGARINANSTTYDSPINISDNLADSSHNGFGTGGGIYMSGSSTSMQAKGLLLTGNESVHGGGAAIYDGALLFAYFGPDCWDIRQCNQFSDNRTDSSGGQGGALYLNGGATIIEHAHLTENKATEGSVVKAENDSSVVFTRDFIHHNGSDAASPWADQTTYHLEASNLIMTHITSVANQAQAATIRQYNSEHHISNSIFAESITNQFGNFINANGIKDCLLLDNDYGIGNNTNDILLGTAGLTADLHLTENSMAIDRCSEILNDTDNQELDIDGELAPFNHPSVNNGSAVLDIGADELRPSDLIFNSSFD